MGKTLVLVLALGFTAQNVVTASAQTYPIKPIRVSTTQAGGGNDFVTRLVATAFLANTGQQLVVDNRPSDIISAEVVAAAPADGYSILSASNTVWVSSLIEKVPYDPVRDFAPIILITSTPNVLVVHPSLPVNSVNDLIALAKAHPAQINYASAATGSSSHLAAELFKAAAGVNMVRIPYKGGAQALVPLVAGDVQVMFSVPTPAMPFIKSGKLRALAVTSARPSELLPGLPTVAASGAPGYEQQNMNGWFAPARTPESVITRLNQEVARILGMPDVKKRLFDGGAEVIGGSPKAFAEIIRSDLAQVGKVLNQAGVNRN